MSTSTLIRELERADDRPERPPVAEWLVAMGPVVHRLDYGGRVAAVGCRDTRAVAALATAYPLAGLDVVAGDASGVWHTDAALRRIGATGRADVEVGGPEVLAPGTFDLVCFLHGIAELADPVGAARAALRALRADGALMVVEHTRSDAFVDGPLDVGRLLCSAGAARTRLAAATPHGFVLDARPNH